MLIAHVEHTKEHSRNERQHNDDHRTFGVATVMNMGTVTFSRCLGSEQEGIKGVIERAELSQLTAFFEVLAELLP